MLTTPIIEYRLYLDLYCVKAAIHSFLCLITVLLDSNIHIYPNDWIYFWYVSKFTRVLVSFSRMIFFPFLYSVFSSSLCINQAYLSDLLSYVQYVLKMYPSTHSSVSCHILIVTVHMNIFSTTYCHWDAFFRIISQNLHTFFVIII